MLVIRDDEVRFVRADVDEALSRCQLTKAELEMETSKVRMEAVGLRDSLIKMQNLNEGLGQDKAELNKILMQVSIFICQSVANLSRRNNINQSVSQSDYFVRRCTSNEAIVYVNYTVI